MDTSAGDRDGHAAFRHRLAATVRFADLDLRGHLNNVTLLRLLETARIEYFADIGVGAPTDYDCVVASLSVDFLASAQFRDELLCGVRVTAVGRTSIAMTQRLWRLADDLVLAEAEVTLVARSGEPPRPTPVPSWWRDKIARWEPVQVPGTL